MAPSEGKYPFKNATLVDCNGDLSKRWYIKFYVWDVQLVKMVRKRLYEVNKFATSNLRRNYARRMIREIKKATIRATSYPSYKSAAKVFKEWTDENKISKMDMESYGSTQCFWVESLDMLSSTINDKPW